MPKISAGLLVYRFVNFWAGQSVDHSSGAQVELFLVHPGGPFWAKKDLGAGGPVTSCYERVSGRNGF